MSDSVTHHKVAIIGSGPAGYTAGLYTARANLNPILFAGNLPGGQLMITTDVENYPGFPDGIQGPEMMQLFRKQVERFGTQVIDAEVEKVDFSGDTHQLWVHGEHHTADAVIIATGASAKWLGIPSEQEFNGAGVSACATCDGFFFRDKDVMVIGGGDTAMEEANFLTRLAKSVTVVHRRDQFRASKIMQDRVLRNPKIKVIWNAVVDEVVGDQEPRKKVTGARLRNTVDGAVWEVPADGIFIAIGHKPNTDIFKGILEMDENGYLIPKPGSTRTDIPGVFVAGDAADHVYRQAVTAAGTGCMAAIDAERYLEARGF
ncbi:MAG: thioredoxin-disulfide reductase [Fimbriimonadaceae bacterium]